MVQHITLWGSSYVQDYGTVYYNVRGYLQEHGTVHCNVWLSTGTWYSTSQCEELPIYSFINKYFRHTVIENIENKTS